MFGFGQLIAILKKNPKKIVFTEGEDARILEAASRLLASSFLHPILIGSEEKIAIAAEDCGLKPFVNSVKAKGLHLNRQKEYCCRRIILEQCL